MFGWYDENGGNKVFWFKRTKGGNQELVRPDGTYRIIKEKNSMFAEYGQQCLEGWQRSKLLMKEYDIWDATSFACSINTILGVAVNRYENDKKIAYLFATPQYAERAVYPFLSEENVRRCRKNVEDFYANPNLQAAWHSFILHPVCIKVIAGEDEYLPVSIESLGCGEGVLGNYNFKPIGTLEQMESIREMMEEKGDITDGEI